MNAASEQLHDLFENSLVQIDSNKFDDITKSVLKLSFDEINRKDCHDCGLTADLCDWFIRCNDYLIDISNAVQFNHPDTPVTVTVSMGVLSIVTNIVRILRNVCTSNTQNQYEVISRGIVRSLTSLITDKHLWAAGEMEWSEWYEQFLHISLQLLFNLTTGNNRGKDEVWTYFYPDVFCHAMKQFSHNSKISAVSIAVLYNCVADAVESDENREKYVQMASNKDVLNLMFSRGLDDSPPEWLQYWCQLTLRLSSRRNSGEYFSRIFAALSSTSYSVVSPAQVLFLHYLLLALDSDETATLGEQACEALLYELVRRTELSGLMKEKAFDAEKLKEQPTDEWQKTGLFLEFLGVSVSIVASDAGHLSERFYANLLHSAVFDIFLGILSIPEIDVSDAVGVVGECGEKQGTPMIQQREDVWPSGTRDAVLQLLSNVSVLREGQDEMRERGGIELVLSHTKMHPKHPLQREWALFTIRNLCAGNEENQRYIEAFKAERVAMDPALEKLGVKVEMADGKVKMTK